MNCSVQRYSTRSTVNGKNVYWEKTEEGCQNRTSSTIEGGRGCNIFVPVLGGNGTKIAPTGDIFDHPLVICDDFEASLPTM